MKWLSELSAALIWNAFLTPEELFPAFRQPLDEQESSISHLSDNESTFLCLLENCCVFSKIVWNFWLRIVANPHNVCDAWHRGTFSTDVWMEYRTDRYLFGVVELRKLVQVVNTFERIEQHEYMIHSECENIICTRNQQTTSTSVKVNKQTNKLTLKFMFPPDAHMALLFVFNNRRKAGVLATFDWLHIKHSMGP